MIYFIQAVDGGPVKIGYATDPKKRYAEIQRMSPAILRILATIEGDRKTEGELHRHFSGCRAYGEWFNPNKELLAFIDNPCFPLRGLVKEVKPTGNMRLKELMTAKGLSLYELAERSEIAYPQLYRLVKAEQIPPGTNLITVKKIARALDVSIEDLETKEE